MVYILVVTMMAFGLNIVVGYAGLLDLGYVAFYAAGAYTAGWLASPQFNQLSFHLGSTAVAGLAGDPRLHVARPHRRRGLHDARRHPHRPADASSSRGLSRDRHARFRRDHPAGRPQWRRAWPRLQRDEWRQRDQPDRHARVRGVGSFDSRTYLLLDLATRARPVHVFCCVRLRDSRLGRAWIAIREDETAAAAMGVPLMRTKTWSYAMGAFFGGVAGAFYASFKLGANPSDFYFNFSIFLLCMVILGGIGSIWGVLTAGFILSVPQHRGAGGHRGEDPGRRCSTSTRRSISSGSTGSSS